MSHSRLQRAIVVLGMAGAIGCGSLVTASPAFASTSADCHATSASGPGGVGIGMCWVSATATNFGYDYATGPNQGVNGQYSGQVQNSTAAAVSASANGTMSINQNFAVNFDSHPITIK